MARWNVNAILCRSCDEKVENIKGIFNTIKVKDVGASFNIVTFINGIQSTDALRLDYCIDFIDGKKRAYVGNVSLEIDGEARFSNGVIKQGTVENCTNDMICRKIERIRFPQGGDYELKIYGFSEKGIIKDLDSKDEESLLQSFSDSYLMATYPFHVEIIT